MQQLIQFQCFFLVRVRRPFPSVLDDISDELLDLNSVSGGSGSASVDPETTSFMTEKLNTNFYPILDVCSVEIPDGETLPEQVNNSSNLMMGQPYMTSHHQSNIV